MPDCTIKSSVLTPQCFAEQVKSEIQAKNGESLRRVLVHETFTPERIAQLKEALSSMQKKLELPSPKMQKGWKKIIKEKAAELERKAEIRSEPKLGARNNDW